VADRAPPIPAGLPWLNVARPLSPEELSGRVRILHFWSAGSVGCQHALQTMAALERRFAGEPVLVVGIHSPRQPHERDVEFVRAAVLRHRIAHPVVVDAEHVMGRQYPVRAWPTVAMVAPGGRLAGWCPGEPDFTALEAEVVNLLAGARAAGDELAVSPAPLRAERGGGGALSFPSKLLARGELLWVGDAGHGEVVEYAIPPRGLARPRRRFGGFHRPHGLALDEAGGRLFVADPPRHSIWSLELASGAVALAAGTTALGQAALAPGAFAPGRDVPLRSPWDLAWDPAGGRLLVAMAGAHQVWSYEPSRDRLRVLAGSGREARHDGDLEDAAFAQPSGLALDGQLLWVGDSGTSAIRVVDLSTTLVRTVAGGDLHDAGFLDGQGGAARLQHPTALALLPDGDVVVADGYNGALRRVTRRGAVTTLAIPGLDLLEPDGLALHAGRLLVADSGHHRVVAVDLDAGAWEVVAGAESG